MNSTETVAKLLKNLKPGEPKTEGPIALVPFFASKRVPDYILGAEAMAAGALQVHEHGGGQVPQLVAINEGTLPVLLLDGEHLEGAMQNRILNVAVMLAPQSKTLLPVSCVEQGRWDHSRAAAGFSSSKDHAYGRLRRVQAEQTVAAAQAGAARHASQRAVWDDVSLKHMEAGIIDSPTGAMGDAYGGRRAIIDQLRRAFAKPLSRQTGVLCLIGGSPVALDAFDRPATLVKLWPRLVSGYAMDAIGSQEGSVEPGVVEEFISIARGADWTSHPGIGLGTDVVCATPGVVGSALTVDEGVAHLAIFGRPQDGSGRRLSSARSRARRHFHS